MFYDAGGISSHLSRLVLFPHLSPPVIIADLRGDSDPALAVDRSEDVWRDAQVN